MKTQYLVFISYGHGAHFNTVVDSVEKVIEVLEGSCDAIDRKTLDQIAEKTACLTHQKNFYTEYDHGTWSTISRMDIETPVCKTAGLDDRELSAVLSGLRLVQIHGHIEEYLDSETPLDNDEIDELCYMLNTVEPTEKHAQLSASLKDRIRILSEAEAIGHMICDDEPINFDDFMKADDVFEIATICELFEHHVTDAIQEHVNDTASVLETFANNIVNTLTTNDMLDIIGQRAYNAGIVSSRGNICLASIHSITASQRDAAERCNGASSVNDCEVFINTEEYDGYDDIVKNAAKFGVSYVLAV